MEKIFEIATNISSPLALSGLFAAIFLFLIRLIIKNYFNNLITKKIRNISRIIKFIINKLFILAIFSMCLGFLGWIIKTIYNGDVSHNFKIEGIVLVDNKGFEDIKVKILELEKTCITSNYGKFQLLLYEKPNYEELNFQFIQKEKKIDTTITIKSNEFDTFLKICLKAIAYEIPKSPINNFQNDSISPNDNKRKIVRFSLVVNPGKKIDKILVDDKNAEIAEISTAIITIRIKKDMNHEFKLISNRDTCKFNYYIDEENKSMFTPCY